MPSKSHRVVNIQEAYRSDFLELAPKNLSISDQIDILNGDANFMTSFARGLAVMQAFSSRKRLVTISQLSLKTGFSRAAVRRCVYTLAKLGYVGTDDNHLFYVLPRFLSLGFSGANSMPLASAALPVLERVSHRSPESCWIGALDGDETICQAHSNATRLNSVEVHVGGRLSAFSTSVGRVLLANLPPEKQEYQIARTNFRPRKTFTSYSPTKIRQILHLTKEVGYSIVNQELETGVWAAAVPIHNPLGNVVAGLCIATLSQGETSENMLRRFLPRLRRGSRELGMLLR